MKKIMKKNSLWKLLICGAGLFVSPHVISADKSIFGFELGKPLNLPECAYTTSTTSKMKLYETVTSKVCKQDPMKFRGYGQAGTRIVFPAGEAPLVLKNWMSLIGLEVDGVLIGVEFYTAGASSQSFVLSTLKNKYGAPTKEVARKVQNLSGATFDAVSASWELDGISVKFEGILDKIDSGNVIVDLPKARELRNKWESEKSSERRQM